MATNSPQAEQPLVSIVVPFLDAESFLDQAVRSVLSQTYTNWELLLVDDGSTDDSTQIARSHERNDPARISYLEHGGHLNMGDAASRNLGIERASGDLIAFLDADDVFLPFRLERQVATLLSNPEAGLLIANTLFWHAAIPQLEPEPVDFVPDLSVIGIEPGRTYPPPSLLVLMLENEDTHPVICSVLVRREVFEEVGGFEKTRREQYQDTTFLAKAYMRFPVFVSGDCSAVKRSHGESKSLTAIASGEYHPFEPNPARGAYLDWLAEHLERFPADDAVNRALAWELIPYRDPARYRQLARTSRSVAMLADVPRFALNAARRLRAGVVRAARRWATRK